MNNEITAEEITEGDEGALKFLKDIKWNRVEKPKVFKLEFFFDQNPYFKNTVLTKTYHMIDEDEPILEKAIGTEIEWYPGKCLTQKILKKKPKKGSKNTKPITKTEECESFFNFFSPPHVPDDEEDLDDDMIRLMNSKAIWSTTMILDQPSKTKSSCMLCHGSLVKLLRQMTLRWRTTMRRWMRMMMRRTRKMMMRMMTRKKRQSKERRTERRYYIMWLRGLPFLFLIQN